MRDYQAELENRAAFVRQTLREAGASGIVFGNSGGKDSALAGIICKRACENTVGLLLPCSKRNFGADLADGRAVAEQFGIETRLLDLSGLEASFAGLLSEATELSKPAKANLAPRLRMTALYAVAGSENRLVAGTGNRSETYMGYFTKWGDGAYDVNPIADLTVTEVYEFLGCLRAPECVIRKAPSAALFDGQTDEGEMGITYAKIDDYLLNGAAAGEDKVLIERFHAASSHKRNPPASYGG